VIADYTWAKALGVGLSGFPQAFFFRARLSCIEHVRAAALQPRIDRKHRQFNGWLIMFGQSIKIKISRYSAK
jgi:hypothetical protein